MDFQRTAKLAFLCVGAGVLAASLALTVASPQSRTPVTSDPFSTYIGTWVATNPGETAPFLMLQVTVVNGELKGTMSHFKIGGVRNGELVLSPLTFAESPISDLTLSHSSLWFMWGGDPPFHAGQMRFIPDGTNVARISLFMNPGEAEEIFAHNKGVRGLPPVIRLHREGTVGNQGQLIDPGDDWEPLATIRLINEAEVQYRFDHGVYVNYLTLLNSGQLEKTGRDIWKVLPVNLNPKSEPLPGYVIRLALSDHAKSYELSIVGNTPANCTFRLFSNETGVAERKKAECATE